MRIIPHKINIDNILTDIGAVYPIRKTNPRFEEFGLTKELYENQKILKEKDKIKFEKKVSKFTTIFFIIGILILTNTEALRLLVLLLRRIRTSRCEGNGHIVTTILRSLLDACASAQDNQVGKRHILIA